MPTIAPTLSPVETEGGVDVVDVTVRTPRERGPTVAAPVEFRIVLENTIRRPVEWQTRTAHVNKADRQLFRAGDGSQGKPNVLSIQQRRIQLFREQHREHLQR